jgi:2-keto-4-pentenoate hydratase/2-oxohepta-3-ene-1,7-dioic acid hydratase in catechol pathway
MQFVNLIRANGTHAALFEDGQYWELPAAGHLSGELGARIARGEDLRQLAAAAKAGAGIASEGAPLAPVLTRPGKIVCLGLNYYDHAKEGGREKPTYPWFFLRAASSLLAHGQPALLPAVSDQYDFEAELAVVIGQRGKWVRREHALELVLGYACFNDLSVRDYQKKTPQWTIGKNFDASGAFGPALVLADAVPAGGRDLRIQCRVNGQVTQDANTSSMIFDVAETIELLTECMTLEPGDVIVMGTPSGVGFARTPPLWLKHGDCVEVEIEKVGLLKNLVQRAGRSF